MKVESSQSRSLAIWASLLAIYAAVFLAIPINFATADLGRHITNGALLLQGMTDVLTTNFYSFTEPKQPFTNHHWGSGVIFHLVNQALGFSGLSLLYLFLSVSSLAMMVKATAQKSSAHWALLITMLVVPLYAYRVEVRPEGFSYLLLAIYYMMLSRNASDTLSFKTLLLTLIPLQLLWVNLHIFFFLGIGIAGMFLLDAFLIKKNTAKTRQIATLLGALVSVSLINPHFHRGLLAPLTIFNEYGYMVIENQTVLFLQDRFGNPEFIHLELFGAIAIGAAIWAIVKGKWKSLFAEGILYLGFLALSAMAVRGIPLFVLFCIPFLAGIAFEATATLNFKSREVILKVLPYVGIFCCVIFIPMKGSYASANKEYNALGTFEGVETSGKFLERAEIPGHIFNNYDIGSYLIYFLKEKQKVFVDNRPEAYSVAFFDSIYKPMQENDAFFKQMVEKYDINTICFYRHDATPWAQPFLIRRTQDADWVPILVDDVSIILIRNIPSNKPWIEKYALPREMFQAVPN